ncbi:phytanoyl-CoA dioxygenase family protein [Burkholderia cepacia]|uniref:phytanoyl-CoA dioxygenase family protein n=1 Tax=Burkholderia cepacia TaxID=292 RepID=UPI002AB6C2DB|nr:phytanoyl-CoA dioxygenase family protein [Burkholderia cepacia]
MKSGMNGGFGEFESGNKSGFDFRLNERDIENFRRESVINLGKVFSDEEMKSVQESFDGVCADPNHIDVITESGSGIVRSVMGWENANPLLAHFATDIRILGAVQSIIGEDVVFHQTKYNPKAPSGAGEKWDPHRGITFWHYLDGVPDPTKIVSIFIAVTDQTKENGATYTWKRAHHMSMDDLRDETDFSNRQDGDNSSDTGAYLSLQIKPEKIAEYDRKFEKIYLEGPAGTAWILDSRNLHASQPNLSNKVRVLVANVYRSVDNHPIHPRDNINLCNTGCTPIKPAKGEFA